MRNHNSNNKEMKTPILKEIYAAVLAFAGTCALPWILKSGGNALGFTNSILSVFVFLGLFWLFYKAVNVSFLGGWKGWRLPGAFGTAFSLCMVMGTCLDEQESVPFNNVRMWAAILVLAVIFTLLTRYFWEKLMELRKRTGRASEGKEAAGRAFAWLRFSGIIFLLYIPVFLAVYPGFFVYDAQDELLQVMTRSFTTHHPLVHVLFLGGIISLVHKLTGSYNLGIACYTVIQMGIMAGIFGWCVGKLKSRGLKKGYVALAVLYFGLCPVLVMFSLCSAKDGLFAGMLLVMVVLFSELLKVPEGFMASKGKMALLAGASLLMMLLRHNGVIAFVLSAAVLLGYLRKYWKKLSVYLVLVFGAYLIVHNALTLILSADASENQEVLTVPISQMARVYQNNKDSLPEEEKEILYRYLPEEALNQYTPKVSDGVKVHFNNQAFAKDKGSFLKLWFQWGTENPFTYLNAWFMTAYGFWYPDTVIDVYRGNTVFTYTYEDSSYFGYEVEQPGTRQSILPGLNEIYRRMSLEIFQQKVPVVSMLFSPGFLFWVTAFCLCFWAYQKRMEKVVPYLPVICCYITVLFGPTYLVRYVVYFWAVLPLLLAEFDN